VAICEQLSPPNKKGLVERDVIRVVTPGTMLDEKALEKKENNYLISITLDDKKASLAIADVSTGYFAVMEKENYQQWLLDELAKLSPSECILSEALYNDGIFLKFLKIQQGMNIYSLKNWESYANNAQNFLKEHFGLKTLAAFGIEEKPLSLQ